MPPSARFEDPVPSRSRRARFAYVAEPECGDARPDPELPAPTVNDQGDTTVPSASGPPRLAIAEPLVAIILEPLAPGESPSVGFARKEVEIVALLDTLAPPGATALHDRLATARSDDPLVAAFQRLSGERRGRLLEHLRDAPRRTFLLQARGRR